MINSPMSEAIATGEEVEKVINNLEIALDGEPRGLAVIALLSLSLVIQSPTISAEELQFSVKEVSRFICMLLDGTGAAEGEDPKLIN